MVLTLFLVLPLPCRGELSYDSPVRYRPLGELVMRTLEYSDNDTAGTLYLASGAAHEPYALAAYSGMEPEELPKPIQQNPTQEPQQPEPLPSGRGSKTPSGELEVSESHSRRSRKPREKPSVKKELEEIKAEQAAVQQKILHRAPRTRGDKTIYRKPKEVTR